MSETEPVKPFGVFHDVETGEVIIRDLTPEEIAALPEGLPSEEQPNSIGLFDIAHRLRRPHPTEL